MIEDSRIKTSEHISKVRLLITQIIVILLERANGHDSSKLVDPEKEIFDEWTPKLAELTYGSVEYKNALEQMKPALKHHYLLNRHHPEHFSLGVQNMNLIDLIEMICDWKAATQRHNDGDIRKSIEINTKRFSLSPQLVEIFHNTIRDLGW